MGITSTEERKRAIVLNAYPTAAGQITDVSIRDNEIIAGGQSPMLNGITFNDGGFPRVDISDNTIRDTAQSEIVNNSTGRNGVFHVNHRGRGSPANHLRASVGSRWVDRASGQTYTFQKGAGSTNRLGFNAVSGMQRQWAAGEAGSG